MAEKSKPLRAEKIRPDMRSPEEALQVRAKALKTARMKAKVMAKKKKVLDRRVQVEEYQLMRVNPPKCYVATYFLQERSGGMICRQEWYKFHIPEDRDDPEVTLQLWTKPSGREPTFCGEAGDLYSLELHHPNGESYNIHIIVPSAESRENPDLLLQYSCFDVGGLEKAFTVDSEAWMNYLLFRDDTNKEDLDSRLLYHAIFNRYELGDLPLVDFADCGDEEIKMLIDKMIPGGDYPRPTVAESLLATDPSESEPTAEVLRAQDEEDAALEEKVASNLDLVIRRKYGRRPSFKEILDYEEMVANNLGYASPKKRTIKRKRLQPYPRREVFKLHSDVERQKNKRLNKYLEDCMAPGGKYSEETDTETPQDSLEKPEAVPKDEDIPPLGSPSTLTSWSGSGWATEDDKEDDESPEVTIIMPLDDEGRFLNKVPDLSKASQVPRSLKPEKSWEASYKAEKDVDLVLAESREERMDETFLSLMSSLSGIDVLDRSSELESLVRDSTSTSTSSEEAGQENSETGSIFDDSVEVFLAKHREEEIVTLSTDSDTSGNNTPEAGPTGSMIGPATQGSMPVEGPGEISILGRRFRWNVPALVAEYPGGFIDDLVYMGVPRELWPFPPVDGEQDDDDNPDDGCDYKHNDEGN